MSNDNLDKNVKNYYNSQSLDPAVMSRLKAIAETKTNEEATVKASLTTTKRLKMAVAASLFLVFSSISYQLFYNPSTSELIQRIAQEVELNHSKQFKSDFLASNYSSLAASMDKLNFLLQAPKRLTQAGYQIVGARYCSIQGQIAAQIKLLDKEGKTHTLYTTKLNEQLTQINSISLQVDNLLIEQWHEGKLFYSLASPHN